MRHNYFFSHNHGIRTPLIFLCICTHHVYLPSFTIAVDNTVKYPGYLIGFLMGGGGGGGKG